MSSLHRGLADYNLWPCLLLVEHALHVDYMGRSLFRECEFLLFLDNCLLNVAFSTICAGIRGCRQKEEEVSVVHID